MDPENSPSEHPTSSAPIADPAPAAPAVKSTKARRPQKSAVKPKPKRTFPKAELSDAISVAQVLKDYNGGNPWPPKDVAKALGMGSVAPGFFYITAAARDFGLTEGTRDAEFISLTELGRELVYAPDPETEARKKIEAFNKVDIFAKVVKHYKGNNLPEMKYLGNTLEREFGLHPEFHAEFAEVFRRNCAYLKITKIDTAGGDGKAPSLIVAEPGRKGAPVAFVIMPFVERNPERPKGFFSEVLKSLISPAGAEHGFHIETAIQSGSDVIQSTIVNQLLQADLVIADLTDHNPNVLFELGLRMAVEKPVALIKASGTGRVFDVDNMLRVLEYHPQLWPSTLSSDIPQLGKHFKAAWDNRDKNASYMKILRRAPALEETS